MTARGPRTPDVGRIYDALLGGMDNFAEDREAPARPEEAMTLTLMRPACPGQVAGPAFPCRGESSPRQGTPCMSGGPARPAGRGYPGPLDAGLSGTGLVAR